MTNRKLIKEGDIQTVIRKAIDGGVDTVILREKDLSFDELYPIAYKLRQVIDNKNKTEGSNKKIIINSNIDVAKEINADGFHTNFENFINKNIEFNGLIGVSVHSLEEAVLAEKNGASYLLASHIYKTDCKKGLKPRGLDFIKSIRENTFIPLIGLGGINDENLEDVILKGADGIAVMSYIMADENPFKSAQKLKNNLIKVR
ncbi:thiamine phosphate synthase [Clostridium oceanicum]|uniref:thiamine phosphate synthase n=1 Tax=Clostridium oceanicum TaxID=1543 RepID=UPI0031E4221A